MRKLHFHPLSNPWHLPILLFVALSAATLFGWQHLKDIERTAFNEELNRTTAGHTTDIQSRLTLHGQFVRSLHAFVSTQGKPDVSQWEHFSQGSEVFESLQGMFAFAYAPAINSQTRQSFTVNMKKRLKKDSFAIFPPTDQELILPLELFSPPNHLQDVVLGFDILSEKQRREAIQTAVRTRDLTLSGRVFLITDGDKRPGFQLFKAVYRQGMPLNTVSERQAALNGVVLAAYRVDDFIQPVSRTLENRFILQIFDDGGSDRSVEEAPQLLYNSDPNWTPATGSEPLHHEIQFGDRNWIVHFYLRNNSDQSTPPPSVVLLVSGLLLSLLIALLTFRQTSHRSRAEDLARQLNVELYKSEERFRLATQGTNDGLWDQNLQTGEEYYSPRMGEIFGFSREHMPHRMSEYVRCLISEDEARRKICLRAHLKQGQPYDIKVQILTAEGRQVWIRIRGEAVRGDNGRMIRFSGSVSDVTLLHAAEEELRTHRDELQTMVEERTTRLEKALHDANRANEAKSEFLANMSHELRTPMHAIISFSQLGEGRAAGPEQAKLKQYFERISQSANRLLLLINDLLDLSKLESARYPLDLSAVNLLATVKSACAQLDSVRHDKSLNLSIDTPETLSTIVTADLKRIEQIVHNLLSNAIKFSPAKGDIRLVFSATTLPFGRRVGDELSVPALMLEVIDHGPGIPEDELESIFDKFYQSTRTRTGAGGTGLGLAICREAVIQHHGTISASNNQEGGATLTVTLPCNPPMGSITT